MKEQGTLGVSDAEFWDKAMQAADAGRKAFIKEGFQGVFIDAPRMVDIAARDTLPVVGIRRCEFKDLDRFDIKGKGILVAVRMESRETFVGRAFYVKPVPGSGAPQKKEKKAPKGYSTDVFQFSLPRVPKGLFVMPWQPGTYRVTVLVFDRRTNIVTSRLDRGAVDDPEVGKFLESMRIPGYPEDVYPPAAKPEAGKVTEQVPHYREVPGVSPAVPDAEGIELAVARVVVHRAGARCVIRGAFRLPVLPRHEIRPRPAEGEPGFPYWLPVSDPEATAVLPLTLILTGKQHPGPSCINLRVPVFEKIDGSGASPLVTGHFNIDLFAHLNIFELADTLAIWAVSGPVLAGPVLMATITEDMLPLPGE